MKATASSYQYGQRQVIRRANRSLFLANGQLGGYIAAFLGVLSFLAVLCFYFPTYLTNAEFRASYDPEQLKWLLKGGIVGCFVFAGINFVLRKRRKLALVGVLYALLALVLGAWDIQYQAAADNPYSLGLDWFILTFLGSATVGIGMEKLLPKYRKQQILRTYWRLDFAYFVLNHLILSAYILIGTGLCGSLQWALLPSFQQWVQSLPSLGQFALLVLIADFCLYGCHRAFHKLPALWGFHAVHHSCEHMDWLAGSRSHFLYNVVERSMMMFVLAFVGA